MTLAAEHLVESGAFVKKTSYGTEGLHMDDKYPSSHLHQRVNSWQFSGALVIANTIGVGCLTMAGAVDAFGGIIPGAIGIIVVVALNAHMSIIVWRLYRCFSEHTTYVGMIGAAFADCSATTQQIMVYATGIAQYGYIFSCVAFNIMTIGKGIGNFGGILHLCLPYLMLIGMVICFPMQLTMRNIHSIQALTWFAMFSAFVVLTIPILFFIFNGVHDTRLSNSHVYWITSPSVGDVLSGMSAVCFNLSTQYILVEILSEMKNPEELPRSYGIIAVPFQTLMLCIVGLGGYFFLGSQGSAMLTLYMPFGSALFILGIFFEVSIIVANLINGVVLCRAAHRFFSPDFAEDGSPRDWSRWTGVVVTVSIAAWAVANLIPFFTDFIDILGSTFAPISCYVIPVITYVHCYQNSQHKRLARISTLEWLVVAVESAAVATLIFYGSYVVGSRIIANWSVYGYPFQCNCGYLWNTCTCSADRPGMASKCLAH